MRPPKLDRTQIHAWTASLSLEDDAVEDSYLILSDDERARADRFQAPCARSRFVAARAFLRRLLSTYLRTDPASLDIGYGPHGKPHLADGSGISFNLSHAEDTAAVAIALQREVGVDIEATNQDVDFDGVARHAFSPAECRVLAALAPAGRNWSVAHMSASVTPLE